MTNVDVYYEKKKKKTIPCRRTFLNIRFRGNNFFFRRVKFQNDKTLRNIAGHRLRVSRTVYTK